MLRFLLLCAVLLLTAAACGAPTAKCSVSTCQGCCDAAGACQLGTADATCGFGGAACGVCGGGLVCQVNTCALPPGGGGTGGGTGGALGGGTGGAMGGGAGGGGIVGPLTVSGRVAYDFVPLRFNPGTGTGTLDFAASTQRPVRNGEVRVVEGSAVLGTTTTGADGSYSLSVTATGAGAVSVQALARTRTPSITVQDNTANSALWAIGAAVPAGGGTIDLRATHGWNGAGYTAAQRTAGPFAILDSMYTATLAFTSARPNLAFTPLKVNWSPNNTTATNGTVEQGFIGTSYFDGALNEIFVVGKDQVDTDEYDNHVIVHEWAHYFEANLSRSDSLGGDHSSGDVLDPRDAFSEGWGDAASGMLLTDPIYADSFWTGAVIEAFGWDLETQPSPSDDPNPGVFSESTVMRVLYDLWDTTNEGGFDRLSLGLGPLADAFTAGHKNTDAFITLGSFVTALRAQSGVNGADLDALLANSSVGSITTDFGAGDAPLRAMYVGVTNFPFNANESLDGREAYNFRSQNRYYVVTGNGARISVSANSGSDVGIAAYRKGVEVGSSDNLSGGGTESFSFNAANGTTYLINLVGYGTNNSTYAATVTLTSP